MRRTIALAVVGLAALAAAGCGVSKSEFQELQAQTRMLEQKLDNVQRDQARTAEKLNDVAMQTRELRGTFSLYAEDLERVRRLLRQNLVSLRSVYRKQLESVSNIIDELERPAGERLPEAGTPPETPPAAPSPPSEAAPVSPGAE